MKQSLPDYQNLDHSGEVQAAAARMEARAQEPASDDMFERLVAPLLGGQVKTVCELGCGTAALARRIARAAPQAVIYASDKSAGMLHIAQGLIDAEGLANIHLLRWDLLDESTDPFPVEAFDLIISSVVIPYLADAEAVPLISRLAGHLAPGGILAFMEQDWLSDTIHYPQFELPIQVLGKDNRRYKRTLGLGLRPVLREAGLQVLPRRSFLWTDGEYGPYVRDLVERFADAASDQGRITAEEREAWKQTLIDLADAGDFFYGIVYHMIAGKRVQTL